jgi:hypothetical protein
VETLPLFPAYRTYLYHFKICFNLRIANHFLRFVLPTRIPSRTLRYPWFWCLRLKNPVMLDSDNRFADPDPNPDFIIGVNSCNS